MTEAATGEDERQVLVAVRVGVAEAATVEDLGAVEEVAASFAGIAEGREHLAEHGQLGFLDLAELGDLVGLVAVVGEAVGLVLDAGDMRYDGEGAERERDDAGTVRLQREADEVEHQARAGDDLVGVGDVLRHGIIDLGLRTVLPGDATFESAFEFADALEVLVETSSVLRVGAFFESLGLVEDQVEHTAAGLDATHGGRFLLGRAGDEEFPVKAFSAGLGGQDDAGAGDGDRVGVVFALADRHGERGEAGVFADFLRGHLVERKAVAEGRLTGMRRAGKEALAGVVIAVDTRVGESGEGGELVALLR